MSHKKLHLPTNVCTVVVGRFAGGKNGQRFGMKSSFAANCAGDRKASEIRNRDRVEHGRGANNVLPKDPTFYRPR